MFKPEDCNHYEITMEGLCQKAEQQIDATLQRYFHPTRNTKVFIGPVRARHLFSLPEFERRDLLNRYEQHGWVVTEYPESDKDGYYFAGYVGSSEEQS